MPPTNNPNMEMLQVAVDRLGPLVDDLVFLGGCATGLLLTDPAAPPIRITRDVDAMVEVATLASYHNFNEKLRKRGFSEDTDPDAPICRWQSESIVLDIMPTDPELLGFGNQWFGRAFKQPAIRVCHQEHKFGCCPHPILWQRKSRRLIFVGVVIFFSAGMSKI